MFSIYINGEAIHNRLLEDENRLCINPTLTEELNRHGSLSLSIAPPNPLYEALQERLSYVSVLDDNGEIWRGRIIEIKQKMNLQKDVYCEGELSYLCDSIYPPFAFSGSPATLFETLINWHNSQVDAKRQFAVGNISDLHTIDPNDYITRSSEYAQNVWNIISGAFLQKLGGYIRTRKVGATVYVDYLADYPRTPIAQPVEFGKNIINLLNGASAAEIVTCLYPYGAKIDSNAEDFEPQPSSGTYDGNRVTIRSVNDDIPYIKDAAAVERWGEVWGTRVWDDVTVPANLKSKAEAWLAAQNEKKLTVSVNAIDLSLVDDSQPKIAVGEYVTVSSAPHNFGAVLICQKRVLPMTAVERMQIVLGDPQQTLTQSLGYSPYSTEFSGGSEAPPRLTDVNFTDWNNGRFSLTAETGQTTEYAVEFDQSGNPTKISSSAATVTVEMPNE